MKLRVLTALVGIPLVVGAVVCANHLPLLAILFAVMVLGLIELSGFYPDAENREARLVLILPAIVLAGVLLIPSLYGLESIVTDRSLQWILISLKIPLLFLIGIFAATQIPKRGGGLNYLFASLWIIVPLFAFCLLSLESTTQVAQAFHWNNRAFMILFPLWAGDSAGIFVGKALGKHPLAPQISPNKTWEGAIANLSACVALALVVGYVLHISFVQSLLCGIVCGVLGQVGDLFESSLKRAANLKDSGTLLPGHGGILDRLDSLLFAAPFIYLILSFKF